MNSVAKKKKWIEELTDKEAEERNLKKNQNFKGCKCTCILMCLYYYNTSYVMITTE